MPPQPNSPPRLSLQLLDLPTEILHPILSLAIEPSTRSGANVVLACRTFREIGTQYLYEEIHLNSYTSLYNFNFNVNSMKTDPDDIGPEWGEQLKWVKVFEGGPVKFSELLVFTMKEFPNLRTLRIHPAFFNLRIAYNGIQKLLHELTPSLEEVALSSILEPSPSVMYAFSALFDGVQPETKFQHVKRLTADYEEIKEFSLTSGFSISSLPCLESLTIFIVDESPPYHQHRQEEQYTYDDLKANLPASVKKLHVVGYVLDVPDPLVRRIKETFAQSGVTLSFELL